MRRYFTPLVLISLVGCTAVSKWYDLHKPNPDKYEKATPEERLKLLEHPYYQYYEQERQRWRTNDKR